MKHYYRKQERLGLPLGVNITLLTSLRTLVHINEKLAS